VVGKTAGRKTVFGDPMLLKRGRASYQLPTDVGVASWGDYSRTTLDPEDDKTFWTIQQVAVDTTHWPRRLPRCTSNTESCWRWASRALAESGEAPQL